MTRFTPNDPGDAEVLKRALRAAGFTWGGNLSPGVYVKGSVPADLPMPYLDSQRKAKTDEDDGRRMRFLTRGDT